MKDYQVIYFFNIPITILGIGKFSANVKRIKKASTAQSFSL